MAQVDRRVANHDNVPFGASAHNLSEQVQVHPVTNQAEEAEAQMRGIPAISSGIGRSSVTAREK